ncbi:MAG TPA: response regulator [Kofleriaceae bacterium]
MKLYVLIVDDEFGLADITADLLIDRGYEASIEINGKLGLASLGKRRADLVLTDLMMPIMDGPEMIRRMRSDPMLADIPAILMTALPEAVPVGELAQHDAVIVKPYKISDLLALIEKLTKR